MTTAISRESISLGPIDSAYIRVRGIIPAMPDYAYPLEAALALGGREIFLANIDYQQSPIWDWAGELLTRA